MKDLIVYKSFLGATKQYAEWIGEYLKADSFKFNQVTDNDMIGADRIIVMSGTYAGQMPLIGFLEKNWSILKNKKVFVIAVGAVPPQDNMSKASYEKIPEEIRSIVKYIKVMGATPFAGSDKRREQIKKENLKEVFAELDNFN
jgi:flavodoxin